MSTQVEPPVPVPAPVPAAAPAPDGFDDFEELPPRPRRRLATPLHLGLLALLLSALGFIAGVLVEKGQTGGAAVAPTGAAGARRAQAAGGAGAGAGTGGGAGARAGAAAGATVGTISTLSGHTLYLTDFQGTTIKVTAAAGATVVRTATSPVAAIHPGDTAIVQGTKAPDGSLTASSIRATSPNAASGGFGGLFGSGAQGGAGDRGGAAAAPPGRAPTSTKAAPQLFGAG